MRYSQISVLITALFLCLVSCRETIGEQHQPLPKENAAPPAKQLKIGSPIKKDTATAPIKPTQNKEYNKKKKEASDTLRPKVAVL